MDETSTRHRFSIRPHFRLAAWESDVGRHAESTLKLLDELEVAYQEALKDWPVPSSEPLDNAEIEHPALYELIRRRDRLSDSVRIFASMTVEGFLNLYGVVRLGEAEFNRHFERLAVIPKAQILLLVCDSLSVADNDALIVNLRALSASRNSLVHPKSKDNPGFCDVSCLSEPTSALI